MKLTPFQKLILEFLLVMLEDYMKHTYSKDVEQNPTLIKVTSLRDRIQFAITRGMVQ